ncbi:MAG: glycosyltransferase [Planctomycetaceae bacterium]
MPDRNLLQPAGPKIGYVVKRYPRFSETFIVNEILAHEADGLDIEIFSLRAPVDTHFQDRIARVKAPVTYLDRVSPDSSPALGNLKAQLLWQSLQKAGRQLPNFWTNLAEARQESAGDTWQAVRLALLVRERNIDHLHAHFATAAATVARLAAKFAGITFSFTAHAKDIFHEDVGADDLCRKLSDASSVITVSDFNEAYLRDRFPDESQAVCRIYNGLDLRDFEYDAPETRSPLILAVGRLVEKKGFCDLVSACEILTQRRVPFHCRIIGDGDLHDELQSQIRALGLFASVELAGPRPQQDVIRALRESAVFAAPCIIGQDGNRDGLPTVLLEAMALGTPCVSTDVTGIPEVIQHGETGLMVPQHDPTSLADALQKLIESADLRVRLARNARQQIEDNFDVHRNSAAIRELFCSAVASDRLAEKTANAGVLQEAL